jgi:hypothetical protein
MSLLGEQTRVEARTGRKLNNALTLTFKVSKDEDLAIATQPSGIGVLFGFKNGGAGKYEIKSAAGELLVDCHLKGTSVTTGAGEAVGMIEPEEGSAVLRDRNGTVLARLIGHPTANRIDSAWVYPIVDSTGTAVGTITLMRPGFNFAADVVDTWIHWDRAGQSLKVPTLGTRLELTQPVDAVLGDLLMGACVDLAIGPRGFLAP